MTLKEIAAEAGVSISTASRVINKKSAKVARPEVQKRILEIAEKSGYIPNVSAQYLKTGEYKKSETQPKTIACIFARTPDPVNNPFFIDIARNFEQTAYLYDSIVKHSLNPLDIQNTSFLQALSAENLDGVVVLGRCNNNMLHSLQKYFRHIVYVGLNEFDSKYDQVICNGKTIALSAMNYLFELNHTKIVYIGETKNEIRFNGYCEALEAQGIPLRKEYIVNIPQSSNHGYSGMQKILEQTKDFTAVFCADDSTAIGVMRALFDHHIRIPADVSVISINDNDSSEFLTPPLTTVHIPTKEMGNIAAKVLIDRIAHGHTLPIRVEMPFKIIERKSCAVAKSYTK